MRRKAVGILTLGSAVVCVLSAMLVVRSVWVGDVVFVPGHRLAFLAITFDGKLLLRNDYSTRFSHSRIDPAAVRRSFERAWPEMIGVPSLGIGAARSGGLFILPLWLVPILTAIPPVRWWRRRGRERGRGFVVEMSPVGSAVEER